MQKIISGLLVSSLVFSSTFAGLEAIPTVSTPTVSADAMVSSVEKVGLMPTAPNGVKYSYDADALKKIHDQSSSLIEVVCQSEDVFKNLGVDSQKIKINSVGFTRQDLDLTLDAKNCSLYANRTVRNQTNNGTNDEKALALAQKFVDELFGTQGIVGVPKLSKPEIIFRDNGAMTNPMVRETSYEKNGSALNSVELISNSGATTNPEKIEVKYNTITVVFPYLIGDAPVYTNYGGGKMGITVTVDGNGIMNVNVPLLTFKGVAKTAEKNTLAGLQSYIAQGGNSPYRGSNGNPATISLDKPERVLVYFDYFTPNGMNQLPRKFLSDGIKLSSKVKMDQRSQMNYEMILSDFVIGNNSNQLLMATAISTTDSIPASGTTITTTDTTAFGTTMSTSSSSQKPKTIIKKKIKIKTKKKL